MGPHITVIAFYWQVSSQIKWDIIQLSRQNLLSLKQFKLTVIVEVFSTVEKKKFKAVTCELGKGKSVRGQEGSSREGR